MQSTDSQPSGAREALALAAWLAAIVAGFVGLFLYAGTPGTVDTVPQRWPAEMGALPGDAPTLVVLAHPRCPCTRASLRELERIVAELGLPVHGRVLFLRPTDRPDGWERTDLWRHAASIPGIEVEADVGGALARRMGAETSGHVLLYGPDGVLRFSGGVTVARGHEGGSRALDTLRTVLRNEEAPPAADVVFGCPLFEPCPTEESQS